MCFAVGSEVCVFSVLKKEKFYLFIHREQGWVGSVCLKLGLLSPSFSVCVWVCVCVGVCMHVSGCI